MVRGQVSSNGPNFPDSLSLLPACPFVAEIGIASLVAEHRQGGRPVAAKDQSEQLCNETVYFLALAEITGRGEAAQSAQTVIPLSAQHCLTGQQLKFGETWQPLHFFRLNAPQFVQNRPQAEIWAPSAG